MDGAYRIKGWGQEGYYYEVSQNGRTKKALPWVAISTKHDGKSFRRIMGMKNGDSIYAAWVLMVQVAAKCPVRGVLADDDGPLSAEDLAFKTGLKAETFETAFKVLSDKTIGWLVPPVRNGLQQVVDNSQQIVELRNVTRRNETLRDEDVTERDATEDSPNGESCPETPEASSVLEFPCDGPRKTFVLSASKLAEYVESFPNVDVLAECRQALQWLRDNPSKRKTHQGMPAYLGRWLVKSTDRQRDGPTHAGKPPRRSASELFKAPQQ